MYLLLSLILVMIIYSVYLYNKLVRQINLVREAWSGIDVQLKRRHDLIPNLVQTVKGYSSHEQDTLEEVIALRSQSIGLQEVNEKGVVEKDISRDLKKLLVLAEAYPDLKADKNFLELQSTLTEIEDNLQYARRYYNGRVRDLNILVQSFPSNIISLLGGFKAEDFFEIDYATERAVPDIKF